MSIVIELRRPGPRWWFTGVIVVAVLLPGVTTPVTALPAAVAAAVAVAAGLLPWPIRSITLPAAVVVTVACSLLTDLVYPGPAKLALIWMPIELCGWWLLIGRAVRNLAGRWLAGVVVLQLVALVLLPLRFVTRDPGQHDVPATSFALAVAFLLPAVGAAGVGLYLRSLDDRGRHAVQLARREQRLEVAHSLHDFVAHELTGIVLEAQAAQLTSYDAAERQQLLARIEQAGLRALDSMDDTVRELRTPDHQATTANRLYGLPDLADLVGRFGAAGTAELRFQAPDPLPLLDQEVGGVAYAVVLEALTNVRRHAPSALAVAVVVRLHWGGLVEIAVTNTGGAGRRPELHPGRVAGGAGLTGLYERVTSLGGSLRAGPVDGGWRVTGTLPGAVPGRLRWWSARRERSAER